MLHVNYIFIKLDKNSFVMIIYVDKSQFIPTIIFLA